MVEPDLHAIPSPVSPGQMQRLMQIAHKMYKELQRLLRALIPLLQPHRRIPNRTQDIDPRRALPPLLAEDALLRRVVADAVDVVHRGRPAHLVLEPVCPGGDGREVAVCVFGQDGADRVGGCGVQVYLGDGGDDFVACNLGS